MKDSHVGLLPTWHDTYGYSVLEIQASRAQSSVLNIRALDLKNGTHDTCGAADETLSHLDGASHLMLENFASEVETTSAKQTFHNEKICPMTSREALR